MYHVNVYLDGQKGAHTLHYIASFHGNEAIHYSHTSQPVLPLKSGTFSPLQMSYKEGPWVNYHHMHRTSDCTTFNHGAATLPLYCFPSAQHATKTADAQSLATSLCTSVTVGICHFPGYFMNAQTVSPMPLFGGRGTWGQDCVYHPKSHVVG